MNVVEIPAAQRPRKGGSLAGGLLVAFSSFVIGVTTIGAAATAVVAVVTVVVVVGGARLYVWHRRRQAERRASPGGIGIPGTWNGVAVDATLQPMEIEVWSRHDGTTSVHPASEVRQVELQRVGRAMGYTRATVLLNDGTPIPATFTARLEDVARALGRQPLVPTVR